MTRVPRRATRLLLVCTLVLLAAAGLAGVRLATAGYSSRATVLLSSDSGASSTSEGVDYVVSRRPTLVALARSPEVVDPAARSLGATPASVRGAIAMTAREEEGTVLDLAVEGGSPAAAHRAGTAVLRAFRAAVARVESPDGGAPRIRTTVVTSPTVPPPDPVRPLVLAGLTLAALAAATAVVATARAWWTTTAAPGRRRSRFWGPGTADERVEVPEQRPGTPRPEYDAESARYLRR